jgi:hypothetical protein
VNRGTIRQWYQLKPRCPLSGRASFVLFLSLCAFAGCVSSYHVSETDDRVPGWISFDQFNRDVEHEDVSILLRSGMTRHATNPKVSPKYTQWLDVPSGSTITVFNDSIQTITYSGWVRGMFEGLGIGILPALIVGGLLAKSSNGLVFGVYMLPLIPTACAAVGGLRSHTYRFRFLSTQQGLQSED